MTDRYGVRSNRKKSGVGLAYLVLTVCFVLIMVKWGVPFLINLVVGPSETKEESSQAQDRDSIPPQVPSLSALAEATNSASIFVGGYTEAGTEITVWRNEELAETSTSDDGGQFLIETRLNEGENRIIVKARDRAGNESQSTTKAIIFDKTPANLVIDLPANNTEVFGKNNQNIPISGKVGEPSASITINGNYARVGSDGKYTQTIHLNEGENQIIVKAMDKAGNVTEKSVNVKLSL